MPGLMLAGESVSLAAACAAADEPHAQTAVRQRRVQARRTENIASSSGERGLIDAAQPARKTLRRHWQHCVSVGPYGPTLGARRRLRPQRRAVWKLGSAMGSPRVLLRWRSMRYARVVRYHFQSPTSFFVAGT